MIMPRRHFSRETDGRRGKAPPDPAAGEGPLSDRAGGRALGGDQDGHGTGLCGLCTVGTGRVGRDEVRGSAEARSAGIGQDQDQEHGLHPRATGTMAVSSAEGGFAA